MLNAADIITVVLQSTPSPGKARHWLDGYPDIHDTHEAKFGGAILLHLPLLLTPTTAAKDISSVASRERPDMTAEPIG